MDLIVGTNLVGISEPLGLDKFLVIGGAQSEVFGLVAGPPVCLCLGASISLSKLLTGGIGVDLGLFLFGGSLVKVEELWLRGGEGSGLVFSGSGNS